MKIQSFIGHTCAYTFNLYTSFLLFNQVKMPKQKTTCQQDLFIV